MLFTALQRDISWSKLPIIEIKKTRLVIKNFVTRIINLADWATLILYSREYRFF